MALNLTFWDLGVWTAISALVMLIASEIISPYYGRVNILIDQRKLRIVGLGFGFAFITIAIIKVASLIYV